MNKENGTATRRAGLLAWAPVIVWIGVIFYLSSEAGSMTRTSRFIGPLLEFLFPAASEETLQFYHGLIRKLAHLSVYGVLGLFASRAFVVASRPILARFWYLAVLWLAALVATADELNQSLLTSRTGTPSDVLLDVVGAAAAVVLAALLMRMPRAGRPFR